MASPRVEHMLGEIARRSDEEQDELLHDLPRVLRRPAGSPGPSAAAVRQAIETRERIRRRLAADGQLAGSIAADLDDLREGRLDGSIAHKAQRDAERRRALAELTQMNQEFGLYDR